MRYDRCYQTNLDVWPGGEMPLIAMEEDRLLADPHLVNLTRPDGFYRTTHDADNDNVNMNNQGKSLSTTDFRKSCDNQSICNHLDNHRIRNNNHCCQSANNPLCCGSQSYYSTIHVSISCDISCCHEYVKQIMGAESYHLNRTRCLTSLNNINTPTNLCSSNIKLTSIRDISNNDPVRGASNSDDTPWPHPSNDSHPEKYSHNISESVADRSPCPSHTKSKGLPMTISTAKRKNIGPCSDRTPVSSSDLSMSRLLLLLGFMVLTSPWCVSANSSSANIDGPKYRTAYACEGSTLHMECDSDHVINLVRANFGRFSITICNEHGNTEWSVNCMSHRSHRVLHDKCSQRQNCSVAASTKGFGDPCHGTLKYLEAHFQCVPVNPSHTARPRPPWFLATKTTVSSLTEDHPQLPSLHRNPLAGGSRDHPSTGDISKMPHPIDGTRHRHHSEEIDEPPVQDLPTSTTSTTTTTTLRPPPWLITNTTKNMTASTPMVTVSSSTTSSTTTVKSTSSSTTQSTLIDSPVRDIDGEEDIFEQELEDELSRKHLGDSSATQESNGHFDASSTISSTTVWSPRAEVPTQNQEESNTPEHYCEPSSERGLRWNWTKVHEKAVQPCPDGVTGSASRQCYPMGWVTHGDLSECRHVWLTTLMTRAQSTDNILDIARDVTAVTGSKALYGGDITAAVKLLTRLSKRMAEEVNNFPDVAQRDALLTELVVDAVNIGSQLLGGQDDGWTDLRPPEYRIAVTELLLVLEDVAFLLADNLHVEKTISRSADFILMRLQVLDTRKVAPVTFPLPSDTWESPSSSPSSPTTSSASPNIPWFMGANHPQDTITLPPEALVENAGENNLVKMVFFSYDKLQDLLQPSKVTNLPESVYLMPGELNETRILNSRVVSASLGAGRHIELPEPVTIVFTMLKTVNVTNPTCVFWDYTTSSWSSEGCRMMRYNVTHTECSCDHLTNFAVLMDIHATPIHLSHYNTLSAITYVGCSISILCLILSIVVFQAVKGLKSDRTTIHKNLCICLLLGEIVFLAGVSQTDKPVVCGIVAGLLHYFFLAAFAWMLLEGVHLYVMLVEVFETEKSRARWYYPFAYGFPAVVVTISAITDPVSYATKEACWLSTRNYFIFAFVGPVIAIILANCILLIMSLVIVVRHARQSASLKNKEHSKLASIRIWMRGSFMLMVLLGLTWTFGLFYLNEATIFMAYAFTVLNSLQGLFIFLFHVVRNEKVKSWLGRASLRHSWLAACLCDGHAKTATATGKSDANGSGRNSQHNNGPASSTVGTHLPPLSHPDSTPEKSNNTLHSHVDHNALPTMKNQSTSYATQNSSFNTDALNAAFSLPAFMSNQEAEYQPTGPFPVQDNGHQLYATPPSTPSLSELYDTAGPTLLTLPRCPKQSMTANRPQPKSSKKYAHFPSSTSFSNIPHQHLTSSSSSYDSSDAPLYPRPPPPIGPPPLPPNDLYIQTNPNPGNHHQYHTVSQSATSLSGYPTISHSHIRAMKQGYGYQNHHDPRHNYHNVDDTHLNNLKNLQEDESNYLRPKNQNGSMTNGSFPSGRHHQTLHFYSTNQLSSPKSKVPPRKPERPQKMSYKSHESIRT